MKIKELFGKLFEKNPYAFSEDEKSTVATRILIGEKAIAAAADCYHAGYLIAVPSDLAPAHANCVRIMFWNDANTYTRILYVVTQYYDTNMVPDSILKYGIEGRPIYLNNNLYHS